MSSNEDFNRRALDFERDTVTTAEDVRVNRELRRQAGTWLHLSAEAIEALLPADAVERRRKVRAEATPFTLD